MAQRRWESAMLYNDIVSTVGEPVRSVNTKVERYIGQLTEEDEVIQAVGQLHSTKAGG